MNVHTSNNAELFFKALEDIWVAEQSWLGSPNNAVWHCTQAAEKIMKGFLKCLNMDYSYGHDLKELLDVIEPLIVLSSDVTENIIFLNRYILRLRYKNMPTDPTQEDAKDAIVKIKHILQAFNSNPKISQFMNEAKEVHKKVLKANYEKYGKLAESEN